MYKNYLSVLSTLFGAMGTILAIFSILKMSLKDVLYARTCLGLDTQELSTLRQVYDARVGTLFVIIGSFIQIIVVLFNKVTYKMFWTITASSIFFAVSLWIIMYVLYRKARKTLIDRMPEELQQGLAKRNIT